MSIGVIILIAVGALLIIGGPILAERASKASSKAQHAAGEGKDGNEAPSKK